MIPIALTIAAATAVGFGVEHRLGRVRSQAAGRAVIRVMLWVLLPPVVFVNLARLDPSAGVVAGLGFGLAGLGVALVAAYAIGKWVLRLPAPSVGGLMVVAAFGNTGYLGLPFVAALLGSDQIANALVYDVVITTIAIFTVGFTIGAAFGTVATRPMERVRVFFNRNPALWACAAGLLAPASLSPQWAFEASHIVVFALLPLGFFVVGVTLASEAEEGVVRFPPPLTPAVSLALALKLLVVPGVLLLLSAAIIEVPRSFPVQAAMASAINSIVIGHEYGLDSPLIASAIAWSTAIVVAAGLLAALV
ncbi:MAG: AEC family transporter [Thermoleophilaceae bacterium]